MLRHVQWKQHHRHWSNSLSESATCSQSQKCTPEQLASEGHSASCEAPEMKSPAHLHTYAWNTLCDPLGMGVK